MAFSAQILCRTSVHSYLLRSESKPVTPHAKCIERPWSNTSNMLLDTLQIKPLMFPVDDAYGDLVIKNLL